MVASSSKQQDMELELKKEILGSQLSETQPSLLGRLTSGARYALGFMRLGRKRLSKLRATLGNKRQIHVNWLGAQVDWIGYACNFVCWITAVYCIREYASLQIVWESTNMWFDATAKFVIIAWPFWLVFGTRAIYSILNMVVSAFSKGPPLSVTANPHYSIHQVESSVAGYSRSGRQVHLYELRAEPWRYETSRPLCRECVCRTHLCVSLWRDVPALLVPTASADQQPAFVFRTGQPESACYTLLNGRVQLRSSQTDDQVIVSRSKGDVIFSPLAYCRWLERRGESCFTELQAVTYDDDCELYVLEFTEAPHDAQGRFMQEFRFWTTTYAFLHGYLGLSDVLFDAHPCKALAVSPDLLKQVQSLSQRTVLSELPQTLQQTLLAVAEQALQLQQGSLLDSTESVFSDAKRSGLDQLQAYSVQRLDSGSFLCERGELPAQDVTDSFIVVLQGELEVLDPVDSDKVGRLFTVCAGQWLFLPCYPCVYPYSVHARSSCTVLRFARLLQYSDSQSQVHAAPYPVGSWIDRAGDLLRLADYAIESKHYETGDLVCRQGEATDCLYIVRAGQLLGTSRHRAVREYTAGDLIGIAELSDPNGTSRCETVRALGHCELVCVSSGLLDFLVAKNVDVYPALQRHNQLAAFLRDQNDSWWHKLGMKYSFECDCYAVLVLGLCDTQKLDQFSKSLIDSFGKVTDGSVDIITMAPGAHIPAHTSNEQHNKVWIHTCHVASSDVQRTLKDYQFSHLQYDFVVLLADADQEKDAPASAMHTHLSWELNMLSVPCVTVLLQRDLGDVMRIADMPSLIECLKGVVVKHTVHLPASLSYSDPETSKRCNWLARFLSGRAVGLVLSGGGARGYAHLGILRALHEANIPIDVVCGTSMGSFVGAIYADENSVEGTQRRVLQWNGRQLGLLAWVKHVLDLQMSGTFFQRSITATFQNKRIEDLQLPYFCMTSDISRSVPKQCLEGNLAWYVRSSMNIAGPLPPFVDPYGTAYVDGGYSDNMPVDAMEKQFGDSLGTLIAVNVGSETERYFWDGWPDDHLPLLIRLYRRATGWLLHYPCASDDKPALWQTYLQLSWISDVEKAEKRSTVENLVLLVPDVQRFGTVQFSKMDTIVELGYQCAQKKLHEWRTNQKSCPVGLWPYLQAQSGAKSSKAETGAKSGVRQRIGRSQDN